MKRNGYSKAGAKDATQKRQEQEIIKEVFEGLVQGKARHIIKSEIVEKYGVCLKTATNLVRKAYKKQIALDEKELSALRFLQLNRLERIMNEALERRDLKSAVQCADVINKLFGLYETKHKVEITKDVIKFKFAEFDEAEVTEDAQVVAEIIADENGNE